MDLRLYDTLTRRKRAFTPIDPSNVRMYVCGPTVYDFAHIGNARPVIVFDVLFRLLRHLYGDDHVTYARNITDVDDKINDRAARDFPDLPLNEAIRKVTEKTAAQFQADVAALGCLPPTHQPRATEFVLPRTDGKTDMVTFIKQLIARGHAYEAGGEVLFDVRSMPDYGALSGRRLDEQKAGARVAVDAHKRNPADFVLWKLSSENEPGWDSPWGRGRPGWHIECSAMSTAYLGDVFDIHGGGLDLIFPHHENEIAQSRCAHGTHAMANYWMHNGFLQVEGEKMSKSLGNFVTINELLTTEKFGGRKWPGEVLRLNMLRTHYRQPIDWTIKALEESETILRRVCGRIKQFEYARRGMPTKERSVQLNLPPEILEALVDDLNTPLMLSRIGELSYDDAFDHALLSIGIDVLSYARWLRSQEQYASSNVDELVVARLEARMRKDFKESDRIRDELAAMGVVLKDGKDADGKPVTTWEIAR
ncbi:cysteinyl-tRNA synthetase [Nitrobacter winogradskyi Nb-255]|uniref:Cysteine--tRNA ligase n=1 Tax=Nitrobacter winogradskyi (strain ATCC 25391 / DSM 10237 / CIP 104748 / NCIMB 11846 / Nb-255) TaxID=323098 RepID=SYC_NITWN|nr:cysteine--tRNA ligase [Nitrobacter winogradskyi]Q3STA1.1 RecName: Full=Cysteine--tRNA ligase; AltName: Full=Cysteinyl-tRNA synthetase; Short=CysRS [Nitrobacter winogradskyi Nb-255]ABA04490.1 cysteinyl-tRNA synthetase [Nitrobacter winogradskyi Nb-255]